FFFAGCTSVPSLLISARFMLKKKAPEDPLFYLFALAASYPSPHTHTLTYVSDGFTPLFQADPHINTAHGHVVSYWDGSAHYLMYLLMIAAITWGDSYRVIGLYWVGSFLMQTIVYILGNAVGKCTKNNGMLLHSLNRLSNLSLIAERLFNETRYVVNIVAFAIFQDILNTVRKNLLHRPLDLVFIICLLLAFMFCVFRGLIALDWSCKWCHDYTQQYEPYLKDPSAYPKIQMLVSMLYSGPYYIIALYGLLVPGCEWMPDLSLVHSGALAQAQFSYIGASLHTRTPFSYRVPVSSQLVFLLVNLLYTLVPQALCYRCCTQPEFFLRPTAEKKED
uniref:Transmembrane 6 superfamily member 1 n=1 Tax=Oryzias latipes TaxID=8090 RepID=A0A3P9LG57_ORYLA